MACALLVPAPAAADSRTTAAGIIPTPGTGHRMPRGSPKPVLSEGLAVPSGRVRHRNGLCPVPASEGAPFWQQDPPHAGCTAVPLRSRSYCRDLTIALRAWGISGTEGDAL